jgi:outer membrane protein assembly factor BamB
VSSFQQGPYDISTPRWEFQTGGDVFTTPAIVDGKVYFGSGDKYIYCVNAYTGEEIWKVETGHYVRASLAVVGGRVFTGGCDGYFYALDADTGEEIWKTSAGGYFPYSLDPNEADYRSSPVVVGGNVYCGSLDGKVYCLSTSDGNVRWTYDTTSPIHGSPLYYDATVYITSTDGYLYAVNSDGTLSWRSNFQLNMSVGVPDYNQNYNIGTPGVGDGLIYVGGGAQYGTNLMGNDWYEERNMSTPRGAWGGGIRMFAFDAETGESIWNASRAGNTQIGFVPTFYDGYIYAGEFFETTKMDAEDPSSGGDYLTPDFTYGQRRHANRTAGAWVGYQIQGSTLYAEDISRGYTNGNDKLYVGSDIGSVYCLDAEDFSTLSVFARGDSGNFPSSCALWNGRMYTGCTNGKLYCFDNAPVVTTSIYADSDKGAEMYNTETMNLCGVLRAHPEQWVFVPKFDEDGEYVDGSYVPEPSEFTPGLPNQTVKLTLTSPDLQEVFLETTTDKKGYFEFSYSPTEVGEWGWVVYYDANIQDGLTYDGSYGEWNPVRVNSPTEGPSNGDGNGNGNGNGTEPPPADGLPMEYIYAAIAVIIIVVVAVLAYFFLRKK